MSQVVEGAFRVLPYVIVASQQQIPYQLHCYCLILWAEGGPRKGLNWTKYVSKNRSQKRPREAPLPPENILQVKYTTVAFHVSVQRHTFYLFTTRRESDSLRISEFIIIVVLIVASIYGPSSMFWARYKMLLFQNTNPKKSIENISVSLKP